MDDIEIMNNDEVINDVAKIANTPNGVSWVAVGVGAGVTAAVALTAYICKRFVAPKVINAVEKRKEIADREYDERFVTVKDESNDSGATE